MIASLNDDLLEAAPPGTGPGQPIRLIVEPFATQQCVPDTVTVAANDLEARAAVAVMGR